MLPQLAKQKLHLVRGIEKNGSRTASHRGLACRICQNFQTGVQMIINYQADDCHPPLRDGEDARCSDGRSSIPLDKAPATYRPASLVGPSPSGDSDFSTMQLCQEKLRVGIQLVRI